MEKVIDLEEYKQIKNMDKEQRNKIYTGIAMAFAIGYGTSTIDNQLTKLLTKGWNKRKIGLVLAAIAGVAGTTIATEYFKDILTDIVHHEIKKDSNEKESKKEEK